MRSVELFSCAAVLLALSTSAAAETGSLLSHEVNLRASDGTGLRVSVRYRESSPNASGGTTVSNESTQVSVVSSSSSSAIRAVLINRCRLNLGGETSEEVWQQDLQPRQIEGGDFVYEGAFVEPFAFRSHDYRGYGSDCTQELAVVRDGEWLTDPINGTHNFQFSIPGEQP